MIKYSLNILCLLVLSAAALAPHVYAQSAPQPNPPEAPPEAAAISALPASDMVIVVNVRRLLTEALPRLLPAKNGKETEGVLTLIQLLFGTSVNQIDTVAVGFKEPQAISARVIPPFAVVVRGSFSSEKVVDDVRRLFLQDTGRPVREEQYRGRRIFIFDVDEIRSQPKAPEMMVPLEFSVSLLDSGLLAVGRLADVKRTIDAREGYERIHPTLVKLATLKPGAVITIAAFGSAGKNPDTIPVSAQEPDRMFEVLSAVTECALSLEALDAGLELYVFARTGSPSQAQPLEELFVSLLGQFAGMVKDPQIKDALNKAQVDRQGDEVYVRALLPQAAIASYVRQWPTFAPDNDLVTPLRVERISPQRRGRRGRRGKRH
jgi:hypothetical protein